MTPGHSLEPGWRVALRHLGEKETTLEQACRANELRYSGLVDIDDRLRLCQTRLAMCLVFLEALTPGRGPGLRRRLYAAAAARARDAVSELEALGQSGVSEDQKSRITDHPDYAEAVRLLDQLVAEGGAALLEPLAQNPRGLRRVARAVARSVRKYAAPDDRYNDTAPCGIDDDDEGLVVSGRMRMPLSQAILYTRTELLPALRRELTNNPGDPQIQGRIAGLERQLVELRRLRFTPRSTPIVLETGFHTVGITEYTPQGELLVTVQLPVTARTGTNTSRARELIVADIVGRLAGRGVCRRLDEEYRWLRGLESGTRGSSRLPSSRLDAVRGFAALKRDYPALGVLEGPAELRRLLDLARAPGREALEADLLRLLTGAGPTTAGSDLATFPTR